MSRLKERGDTSSTPLHRGVGRKVRIGNGRTTEQLPASGELTQEERERLEYVKRHNKAVNAMQESEPQRLGRDLTDLDSRRIEIVVTAGEVVEYAHKPPIDEVIGESFRKRDHDTRQLLTAWYGGKLAETLRVKRKESPLIPLKLNLVTIGRVYDEYQPGLIDTLDSLDLVKIRRAVQSTDGATRMRR